MAIDKKLIKYATKARFTADLGNSLIPTTSIVFIQDTGELWTHGTFFGGNFSSVDSNYGTLTLGGSSVNLSLYGHKHSYTDLLGSTTTANQVIVSNGTANGWTLKTLGSGAFDSTSYLPLSGGTLTGALITNPNVLGWVFTNSPSYYGSISYDSYGGECLGIMFKNSSTKFKVKAGYDSSSFAGNNAYTGMTNADLEVGAGYAKINGNTVWHAGNDGSGSGLDADTLDGLHADCFLYGSYKGFLILLVEIVLIIPKELVFILQVGLAIGLLAFLIGAPCRQ